MLASVYSAIVCWFPMPSKTLPCNSKNDFIKVQYVFNFQSIKVQLEFLWDLTDPRNVYWRYNNTEHC